MDDLFSDRIRDVPRSFIREILKDALMPGTISFADSLINDGDGVFKMKPFDGDSILKGPRF